MTPAVVVGLPDGVSSALAEHGLDIRCRIASAADASAPGVEHIDATAFVRYRHLPDGPRLVPRALRDFAREAIWQPFIRCADRYANSSAMLNDVVDFELLLDHALIQAEALLDRHGAEVVAFVNAPHRCATLALWAAARARGLRTPVCLQSQFPDLHFIVEDWRDLGRFATARRGEPHALPCAEPERMPFYMAKVDTGPTKRRRALLKLAEFAARLPVAAAMAAGAAGQQRLYRVLDELRNAVQEVRYPASRARLGSLKPADLPAEFVYVPLHLQPEMTTDVLGGAFANQVLALSRLREIVPERIPIIVKENPKQTGLMRSALFWQALERMPGVRFIDDGASSLELVRAARLTATVTGTAGWEALRCGRPALAFGSTFWSGLPGAFRIADEPDWEQIAGFRFDRPRFEAAVRELSRHLSPGVADVYYAAIVPDFEPAANARTLAGSIARHLREAPRSEPALR